MLCLEALALLGLAVLQLAQINGSPAIAASGAVFAGYAIVLVVLARGVVLGRRWSRGPAVATQLIQLPIAWVLREGATAPVSTALTVSALSTVICLLLPSSTAVFAPAEPRPERHEE